MIVTADPKAPRIARYSARQRIRGGEIRTIAESRIGAIIRCLDKVYKQKKNI